MLCCWQRQAQAGSTHQRDESTQLDRWTSRLLATWAHRSIFSAKEETRNAVRGKERKTQGDAREKRGRGKFDSASPCRRNLSGVVGGERAVAAACRVKSRSLGHYAETGLAEGFTARPGSVPRVSLAATSSGVQRPALPPCIRPKHRCTAPGRQSKSHRSRAIYLRAPLIACAVRYGHQQDRIGKTHTAIYIMAPFTETSQALDQLQREVNFIVRD